MAAVPSHVARTEVLFVWLFATACCVDGHGVMFVRGRERECVCWIVVVVKQVISKSVANVKGVCVSWILRSAGEGEGGGARQESGNCNYIYIYIYVYVYMYVCLYIYIYIHIYV